jgi:hypothetical protein
MKKLDKKDIDQEHEHGTSIPSDRKVVCPVCGSQLHEINLVDKEGIIDEMLHSYGGLLIVDSEVTLLCECEHRYDEEEFTLEDPHKIVAVVDAVFDGSGECTQFEITEIRPG